MPIRFLQQKDQRQHGFSIVELSVATALTIGLFLAVASIFRKQTGSLRLFGQLSNHSQRAHALLGRIESALENAQPANVSGFLIAAVDAASTTKLLLDSVAGFPDHGMLLIEPGSPRAERIGYGELRTSGGARVLQLERGLCGTPSAHPAGSPVIWAGTAFAIERQAAPPAGAFDGLSKEDSGPLYFRGLGTGFGFRVPVDLGAGPLEGLEVHWGAELGGRGLTTARSAILFSPSGSIDELQSGADLNGDGDRDDAFDVGDLRLRTWDTNDGSVTPRELGLGGTGVMQERCNWGGDLDGDGFSDPIFLWSPDTGRLRVRLFLVGQDEEGKPRVQRLETTLGLGHEPEG